MNTKEETSLHHVVLFYSFETQMQLDIFIDLCVKYSFNMTLVP